MIYTVTFNPALDYVATVNHFTLGSVNRMVRENIFYGGEGINVSVLLANLGCEGMALGFMVGFTGEEIERRVKALGFGSGFIKMENGISWINLELESDEESEINGMGPRITPDDVRKLFEKLGRLTKGDVLTLSGSILAAIDDMIYKRIMEHLGGRGIGIVVDVEKDPLLNVLKYHPFLIKPNNHELGQMFGTELSIDEEIVGYAGKFQDMGVVNVLVSMAKDGAILVSGDGQVHKQAVARGTIRNSVGAGDSMVAGFIARYLDTGDYRHALKLGAACGGATAFSDGVGTKDLIMKLFETP